MLPAISRKKQSQQPSDSHAGQTDFSSSSSSSDVNSFHLESGDDDAHQNEQTSSQQEVSKVTPPKDVVVVKKVKKKRGVPTVCGTVGRMAQRRSNTSLGGRIKGQNENTGGSLSRSQQLPKLGQRNSKSPSLGQRQPPPRSVSVQTMRNADPAHQHLAVLPTDSDERRLLKGSSAMTLTSSAPIRRSQKKSTRRHSLSNLLLGDSDDTDEMDFEGPSGDLGEKGRRAAGGGGPLVHNAFATAFMSLKAMVLRRRNQKEVEKAFLSHIYSQLKVCEPHLLHMEKSAPTIQLDLSQGWVDIASDQDFAMAISLLSTLPTLAVVDVSFNENLNNDRGTVLIKLLSQNAAVLHIETEGTAIGEDLAETIVNQCSCNRTRAAKRAKREKKQREKEEADKFAQEVLDATKALQRNEERVRKEMNKAEYDGRRKLMAIEHMTHVKVVAVVERRELREEHHDERVQCCLAEEQGRRKVFERYLLANVKVGSQYENTLRKMWKEEEAACFEEIIVQSYESKANARGIEEKRRKRKFNERLDLGRMEQDSRKAIAIQEQAFRRSLIGDEIDLRDSVKQLLQHRQEREHGESRRKKAERDRQEKERIIRRERERQEENKRQNEKLRERDRLSLKAQHGQMSVEKEEAQNYSLLCSVFKILLPIASKRGEAYHAEEKVTHFCRHCVPQLQITGPAVVYTYLDTVERPYPYHLNFSFELPSDAESTLTRLIDQARHRRREAVNQIMKAKNAIVLDSPALQYYVAENSNSIQISQLTPDAMPSPWSFFERRARLLEVELTVSLKGKSAAAPEGVTHKLLLDEEKLASHFHHPSPVNSSALWEWKVESQDLDKLVLKSTVLAPSAVGGTITPVDGEQEEDDLIQQQQGEGEAALSTKDIQAIINTISFAAITDDLGRDIPHYVLGVKFELNIKVPSLGHGSVGKRGMIVTREPLSGSETLQCSFLLNVAVLPSPMSSHPDADALNMSLNENYPTYRQNFRFSDVLRTVSVRPPILPTTDTNGWVKLEEPSNHLEAFEFCGYELQARIVNPEKNDVLFLLLEPDLFTFLPGGGDRDALFVRGKPVTILNDNTLTTSPFTAINVAERAHKYLTAAGNNSTDHHHAKENGCPFSSVAIRTDAEQGLNNDCLVRIMKCISFTCSDHQPVEGIRTIEVTLKDSTGIVSRSLNTFEVQALPEGSHFFSVNSRRRPFHNISGSNINGLASLWINATDTKLPLLPEVKIMEVDRSQPRGVKDCLGQATTVGTSSSDHHEENVRYEYVQILAQLADSPELQAMMSCVFRGSFSAEEDEMSSTLQQKKSSGNLTILTDPAKRNSFISGGQSTLKKRSPSRVEGGAAATATQDHSSSPTPGYSPTAVPPNASINPHIKDVLKYTSPEFRKCHFEEFNVVVDGDGTQRIQITGSNMTMKHIVELLRGISYHARSTGNLVNTGTRNVEVFVEAYKADPVLASSPHIAEEGAPPATLAQTQTLVASDHPLSTSQSTSGVLSPLEISSKYNMVSFANAEADSGAGYGKTNDGDAGVRNNNHTTTNVPASTLVPDVYIRDVLPVIVTDSILSLPVAAQRRTFKEAQPMIHFEPFQFSEWNPLIVNCFNGGYLKASIVQGGGKEDELILTSNTADRVNGIKLTPLDLDTPVIPPPQRVVHLNPNSQGATPAAVTPRTAGARSRTPPPAAGASPTAHSALEKVKLVASLVSLAGIPKKAKKLVKVPPKTLETALVSGSSVLLSPLSNRRGSKYTARNQVPLFTGWFNQPPKVILNPSRSGRRGSHQPGEGEGPVSPEASSINLGSDEQRKRDNRSPTQILNPAPEDASGVAAAGGSTNLHHLSARESTPASSQGHRRRSLALVDDEPMQPFTTEGPTPVVAVSVTERAKGAIRDHVRQTTSEFGRLTNRQRKAGKFLVRRTSDDSVIGVATVNRQEVLISFTPFEEGVNPVTLQDAKNILRCFSYFCHPCAALSHPTKFFRFTMHPTDGTESQAVCILDITKSEPAPEFIVLHSHRRVHQRSFLQVCGVGTPIAPYAHSIVHDVRGEQADYAGISLCFEIDESTKQEGDELVVLSREEQQKCKTLHDIWRQEQNFLMSKDFSLETSNANQSVVEDLLSKLTPYENNTILLPTMQLARAPPGSAPIPKRSEKEETKAFIAFCYTDMGRTDFMRFQMFPQAEGGPKTGPEAMTMVLNSIGLKTAPGTYGERKIKIRLLGAGTASATSTATKSGIGNSNPADISSLPLLCMQNVFINVVAPDIQGIPGPFMSNGLTVTRKVAELGSPCKLLEGSEIKFSPNSCLQRGYLEVRIVAPKDPDAAPLVQRECLHLWSPNVGMEGNTNDKDGKTAAWSINDQKVLSGDFAPVVANGREDSIDGNENSTRVFPAAGDTSAAAPPPLSSCGGGGGMISQVGDALYVDGEFLAKVVVCYNFHMKFDFDWASNVTESKIQRLINALRYTAFSPPTSATEKNGSTLRQIEVLFSDGYYPCNPTFIAINVAIEKYVHPIVDPPYLQGGKFKRASRAVTPNSCTGDNNNSVLEAPQGGTQPIAPVAATPVTITTEKKTK